MDDRSATLPSTRSMPPMDRLDSAGARKRPRLRHYSAAIVALLLILSSILGASWWALRGSTAVTYITVAVTRGDVTRTVTATGTINPELTIIVGSYVSGVIQQLFCDYNTEVKPGQICARIDPRPYRTIVDQARANLGVAKAQLEKDKANLAYTKLNFSRQQRLVEQDSTSKDARDIARNAYEQAQAQIGFDQATIEQRQAELDAAEVNLGYTDIVSPVEGTVVSRNVTQGQTVASSFQTPTLFLIATDLTRMQVDTNVSESDIGGVEEGNSATFTVDAFPKRIFRGKVTQVRQSPQMVQNVVNYDAVISIDNSDLALKPGMTASTRITIDQRHDVLRVPNSALRYTPGALAGTEASAMGLSTDHGDTVRLWVLRDGHPIQRDVLLGLDDENFTEIVKGDLATGDRIIVGEQHVPSSSRSGAVP